MRWRAEGYALGGHAVLAAEVAAFGEGDAEVVVVAVVSIGEYVVVVVLEGKGVGGIVVLFYHGVVYRVG